MIRNFCTYFDSNYLYQGLAFYHSLRQTCPEFRLWVLCMDDRCYRILVCMALPNIKVVKLEDFEYGDNELGQARKNRAKIEYYFTCTPSLPLFILNNFPEVGLITYVDADIYFFSDPEPIFKEMGDHSIGIVEHRFSPKNEGKKVYGIYNVGWLSFRRDENAIDCLNWWRKSCNRWCYERIDGNRCADQKYLDDWPTRFKNLIVLKNKGINVAPWNIANYKIYADRDNVLVDGQLLIFYHFHSFRHLAGQLYDPGFSLYKTRITAVARDFIYEPYLKMLLKVSGDLPVQFRSPFRLTSVRSQRDILWSRKVYRRIKQFLYMVYHVIIARDYIAAPKNRHFQKSGR